MKSVHIGSMRCVLGTNGRPIDLGNASATGHCGAALKANKQASVVLIPGAPHTLMNLPAARHPTEGFLRDVLKP
mgnify:CR=1 FL=1